MSDYVEIDFQKLQQLVDQQDEHLTGEATESIGVYAIDGVSYLGVDIPSSDGMGAEVHIKLTETQVAGVLFEMRQLNGNAAKMGETDG